MMRNFTIGIAAGMAVSAAVALACMPKKPTIRKKIGKTLKSVVGIADDLGDILR